jgi:hypothetical protein
MGVPPDHPSRIETGDDWGSPSPLVFRDHKSGWLHISPCLLFKSTSLLLKYLKTSMSFVGECDLICCKSKNGAEN